MYTYWCGNFRFPGSQENFNSSTCINGSLGFLSRKLHFAAIYLVCLQRQRTILSYISLFFTFLCGLVLDYVVIEIHRFSRSYLYSKEVSLPASVEWNDRCFSSVRINNPITLQRNKSHIVHTVVYHVEGIIFIWFQTFPRILF